MFEEAKHLKLPEYSFTAYEALKHVRQFFQCDSPPIPRIRHCPARKKNEKNRLVTGRYDIKKHSRRRIIDTMSTFS